MSESTRGRLLVICTALLWGLAGVCVKSITWGPLPIVAVRSLISLIMLLILKRSLKVRKNRTNFFGGLMLCLTGILYVIAIKLTNAGTAIVLQYVAPILVFLYQVFFRGKKALLYEILLTVCVFAGIVLSFADSIDMSHIAGNLLALLSGVTFAAQIIIMNGEDASSEDCTVIGNFLSFLISFPFLFLDPSVSFDTGNLFWLLVLSVFQYGLANICFAKGCQKISALECSLLLTIEPIFNPIPVAIFCGEIMGPLSIMGAAIVIVSVTLYAVLPGFLEKKKAGGTA